MILTADVPRSCKMIHQDNRLTARSNISCPDTDVCQTSLSTLTSDTLVNDLVREVIQWIFYSVISELICVFGTVTNLVSIVCFVKMGFRDSVNISLLGKKLLYASLYILILKACVEWCALVCVCVCVV